MAHQRRRGRRGLPLASRRRPLGGPRRRARLRGRPRRAQLARRRARRARRTRHGRSRASTPIRHATRARRTTRRAPHRHRRAGLPRAPVARGSPPPPAGACPDPDSNPAGGPSLRPAADGPSLRPAGKFSLPLKSAPLTAATAYLPGTNRVVLAVGCADGAVRAHVCDVAPVLARADAAGATTPARVEAVATLEGHTDWVRDVAFAESRRPRRRRERLFVVGDGVAG